MARRFFLNALKPDGKLPPPESGQWKDDRDSGNFLHLLAGDIELAGSGLDLNDVCSVPSVFARPLHFYQAFANEDSPMHRDAVAQWRGLLATIALSGWLELTVKLDEFSVPDPEDIGDADLGDNQLLLILSTQIPHPAEEWSTWWMVRCNDSILGATSPWSIVYTAADYRCPSVIPWQNKGKLIDPVEYYRSSGGRSEELGILHRWVSALLETFSSHGGSRELVEQTGKLRRELERWKRDLTPYADDRHRSAPLLPATTISRAPYAFWFRKVDGGEPQLSDLLLDTLSAPQPVVLPERGVDPKTRVFRAILYQHIDLTSLRRERGEANTWRSRSGAEIPLPFLRPEQAFFPEKLLKLELTESAVQFGRSDLSVPLRPQFFEYFTVEQLIRDRMLSVSRDGSGVVARLTLPLVGRSIVIEKHYRESEDVLAPPDGVQPGLAVWPDFHAADWHENFAVAVSTAGGLHLEPVNVDGKRLESNRVGTEPRHVWKSERPIAGFQLAVQQGQERTDAGMVLVSLARPPVPSKAWTVSVDFGTSNTLVMASSSGGKAAPLPMKARKVQLTRGTDQTDLMQILYPAKLVIPPFPTMVSSNTFNLYQERADNALGHTYIASFDPTVDNLLEDNTKYVSPKWGADPAQLRDYLRSVARYIIAEARAEGVASLALKWSYPLALPETVRTQMKNFWGSLAQEITSSPQLSVTVSERLSESEAVCRFLAGLQPPIAPIRVALTIGVDVGGGTTDLAFWVGSEGKVNLEDQVSLKLAGNDILKPLWNLPAFREGMCRVLDGVEPNNDKRQQLTKHIEHAGLLINLLLTRGTRVQEIAARGNRAVHPMVHALRQGLQSESPWREARARILLFYAGLFFYLGLHARVYLKQLAGINLYLGGGGARAISWLGEGDDIVTGLELAFRKGLDHLRSGKTPVDVKIFGPLLMADSRLAAKEEVARGMLARSVPGEKGASGADQDQSAILAEIDWRARGSEKGGSLPWDHRIDPVTARQLIAPSNLESSYIADFLDSVVPELARHFGLDMSDLALQLPEPMMVQEYTHRLLDAGEAVQPIFIVELQRLLDLHAAHVESASPPDA